MIFVTVGNATQGFMRLLKGVDDLARQGAFGQEEIFMQVGHNPGFLSSHCKVEPFISMEEFQKRMSAASLIIAHGGCTVFQAFRLGKLPVVMPRMKRFGEHVNDHQVTFVETLAREKRLVPAYSPEDLANAVKEARSRTPEPWPKGQMQDLVRTAIEELLERKAA